MVSNDENENKNKGVTEFVNSIERITMSFEGQEISILFIN